MGFGSGETAFATKGYELKEAEDTSHSRLLAWLGARPPGRVLDLGCSDGALAARMRKLGHHVTGVDSEELPGARDRVDRLVVTDLDQGIPDQVGNGYDVVVAADVLEHLRWPDRLLADAHRCLRPGGSFIASVPNFGHWYPRARVALGLFDYDRRGILDRGHVRFFTRRSFERLAGGQRYSVRRSEPVGLPLEVLARGSDNGRWGGGGLAGLAHRLNLASTALSPSLFAYQLLYELEPLPVGR
jgi:SAM-dependent methyltransferase